MNVEFEPGKERPLNTLQGAKQDFERDGGLALIPVSWDWSDWDAQLTLPKA